MTILLGLDLETTGLNAQMDEIIEVGIVLWDTAPNRLLEMHSSLIQGPRVPDEITHLTGITPLMRSTGYPLQAVMQSLAAMGQRAEFIVAHNAGFEQSFLVNNGMRGLVDTRRWIDTQVDLPFAPGLGRGSLNDIAMAHHVYNPMPHRALPDALAMMQILAMYPFAEVRRYAMATTIRLEIKFPYDETGERNARVKALGYHWQKEGKCWHKNVKDFNIDAEVATAEAVGFSPAAAMAIGGAWETR